MNGNCSLLIELLGWLCPHMKIMSYMKQTAAMQSTFTIVLQCGEMYLMPFPLLFFDWWDHISTWLAHLHNIHVRLLPCLSVSPLRIVSHFLFNLNLHRVLQYLLLDYRLLLFARDFEDFNHHHSLPVSGSRPKRKCADKSSESISHVLEWHNLAWVGKHKGKDHCTSPESLQMCHTYCGAGGKHAWQIIINICHLQLRGCNKQ